LCREAVAKVKLANTKKMNRPSGMDIKPTIETRRPSSAAVLDAQSTRSSPQGGPSGFDVGKKVKGRQRNLIADTLGLLLAVTVTAASVVAIAMRPTCR
jgi:hypothetical protein